MVPKSFEIERLEWDSNFFGFSVGKVLKTAPSIDLDSVLQWMQRNGTKLLYWPTPDRLPFEFEQHFILTQVTFEKSLRSNSACNSTIAESSSQCYGKQLADRQLRQLAYAAGWSSRFQVDPNIEQTKFRQLYDLWIDRSCLREIADEVLVTSAGEEISGFVTLKAKHEVTQIGLIAVDERYRGQGVGSVLMKQAEEYALAKGCRTLKVVTQLANDAAIRLYSKHGLKVADTQYWYHIWRNSVES